MDLKFYLNKFCKVDNIEEYTLKSLFTLKKCYEDFMSRTEGMDPDFPSIDFSGGKKGKKLRGRSKAQVDAEEEGRDLYIDESKDEDPLFN